MGSRAVFPSTHYPDYLKRDLGAGGKSPNPLSQTLDEIALGWFHLSHELAYSLIPDFFTVESQKQVLHHLGFRTDALSSNEVTRFFDQLNDLFKARSTLTAVTLLGEIFFGATDVRRGRPLTKQKLRGQSRCPIRLSDGEDTNRLVFVRLKQLAAPDRITDFIHNGRLLIPEDYDLMVALPVVEMPLIPAGVRLKTFRLNERRL